MNRILYGETMIVYFLSFFLESKRQKLRPSMVQINGGRRESDNVWKKYFVLSTATGFTYRRRGAGSDGKKPLLWDSSLQFSHEHQKHRRSSAESAGNQCKSRLVFEHGQTARAREQSSRIKTSLQAIHPGRSAGSVVKVLWKTKRKKRGK